MKRKLFTLAAAVSAALCAGVCVLWLRSYFARESATLRTWSVMDAAGSVDSSRGAIILVHSRGLRLPLGDDRFFMSAYVPAGRRFTWQHSRAVRFNFGRISTLPQRLGLHCWSHHVISSGGKGEYWYSGLALPAWLTAATAAIVPAWWLRRTFQGRPRRRLCRTCGYDLRATPERCPECGAVPERGAA
jgi:hypothetical protein